MTKKTGKTSELVSLFPEVIPTDIPNDVPVNQINVSDAVDPLPEFVESVRKFGILQPVLLCAKSAKHPDDYEVLAGRRRVLAAKIVGLEMIPAIVRTGIYYADARASAITIEAQRHFNSNPVAEYRAIKKLIADGYTREMISTSLGLPSERIDKLLQLGSLPDNLLDAVQNRKVSITTAQNVAKLAPVYQKQAVDKFDESGKLTGSDVDEIKTVRKKETVQNVQAASAKHEPTLREKIEMLKKPFALEDSAAGTENDERDLWWNAAIKAVLEILD
jgi:ParB/RepB/Spo0J family partition protein